MTEIGIFQIILYLIVLMVLARPLGIYIARVYENSPSLLDPLVKPLEHLIYRISGIHHDEEMNWISYLIAMLIFNCIGMLAMYFIQRLQFFLPLNPETFPAVAPELAFNTAASFITNTNWQAYGGESTMSYLTQMTAMTVQNFLSAATGMSLLVALIRGLARSETSHLGNFWVDTVRGTLYILLPLAFILSLLLVSQGVIQNFRPYQKTALLQTFKYEAPVLDSDGNPVKDSQGNPKTETKEQGEQDIPMGPVASQIAIKQLGTNGGGYFNANSAYPYENSTPLSNFMETLAILLIPVALCFTFGRMVKDRRQGGAVLVAMLVLLIPMICFVFWQEQRGNPAFIQAGIDMASHHQLYPGGNMEGKETRFGIASSTLWAAVTTATSNGSVNSMFDSYTPLGGLVPLWMMHLGEVVFGGVGSGLYGMLMMVIITVFVAGLMVGRTPEYLGKKIEAFEMKMASIAVLVMPLIVLVFTAAATVTRMGTDAVGNPGAHGFSEILYAFTSMVNNNGSAFAGLNANLPLYNIGGGIAILLGRYWIAIPVLALAGSMARKKAAAANVGTLPTHTPLFIILLVAVVIIIGALTFFPALALGPIVEHLMLWSQYGH